MPAGRGFPRNGLTPLNHRSEMKRLLQRIRRFTDHPFTKLGLGLILVVSSVAEGYDTFFDATERFRFRAHHGLLLFGIANVLACLPELFEGMDKAFEAFEERGLLAAAETFSTQEEVSKES